MIRFQPGVLGTSSEGGHLWPSFWRWRRRSSSDMDVAVLMRVRRVRMRKVMGLLNVMMVGGRKIYVLSLLSVECCSCEQQLQCVAL